MNKKTTTSRPATRTKKAQGKASTTPRSEEQLLAIRDLLFGEQVATIQASIESLNAETNKRFTQLESQLAKTSEKFNQSLKNTTSDIKELIENHHLEHVSQESIIEENLGALSSAFDQFQSQTENDFSDAQKELNGASKALYKSLEKEVKALNKKIEKASEELSTNKADRKTLASMLENMASNLTQSQA